MGIFAEVVLVVVGGVAVCPLHVVFDAGHVGGNVGAGITARVAAAHAGGGGGGAPHVGGASL